MAEPSTSDPPAGGAGDLKVTTGTSAGRLALVLCLAEVLGMAGTMTFPALLPTFFAEWGLGNVEAGWINGVFHGGYVAAVPVLVTLTDRVDPRRIYLFSTALTVLALLGFAFLATGFWSATLFRALGGVGLAGTYMPGLRILSDNTAGPGQGRYLSFYTACYALGSSASVLLSGLVGAELGWRAAFVATAAATAAALALSWWGIPGNPPKTTADRAKTAETALLDFRPVLRHRAAMGYILAYSAHCYELFGMRSWLVAFLAFALATSAGTTPEGAAPAMVTTIGTLILLLGLPASILGNEAATRYGRRRVLMVIMTGSAALACGVGFSASLPFWLTVCVVALYGVTVTADSASLTVGAVTNAAAGRRGATMAVHSFLGFGAAFVGSVMFGVVLDLAGGGASPLAWGLAFASQGLVVALGPVALVLLGDMGDGKPG
ncbi:MFS transporter [Skermanella stibiiresistens SB22]|uniref:MFS transporter n=1 Tax=Skermanella stibiiresistens SB22 TaxID=1385369 RepID=W9GU60_9PROT|nr:MFS transporter [Skermanella stibiiresistens]EWY37319.1 MFS transporter [Skermanella stibiiresistens SB22]